VGELKTSLLALPADVARFRGRGPFKVSIQKERELLGSASERIKADLYLSSAPGKAPLVILLHGHGATKEDHGRQALHLASWGMHSLSLQLRPQGPWTGNGNTLARIVSRIHAKPAALDERIDRDRIVLAAHSFGASAVAVALARNIPVLGGVLLDPAGVGRTIPAYLKKVRVPVMVLASDERVSLTRNIGYFYNNIPRKVARISITNASHEDAQFPIDAGPQAEESDSSPVEELQITYAGALTAAAFSLGFTGSLDYAWDSMGEALRSGTMFDPRRK
jgi:pimeloyl-ACP methyl ester carboxylesterase